MILSTMILSIISFSFSFSASFDANLLPLQLKSFNVTWFL